MNATAAQVHEPDSAVADFAAEYWDRFRIAQPAVLAAPRTWAHLALRGAASANGAFSRLVWSGLLGFDLAAPDTPGTWVGWRIVSDTDDAFVLDVDGGRMTGRMRFVRADGAVEWTTMLRFHDRTGRAIWSVAGHAHRALAPRCLQHAHASLVRRGAPVGVPAA